MKNYVETSLIKNIFFLSSKKIKLFTGNDNLNQKLCSLLVYFCFVYNFHRYIFKYSHGGYPKEGYQQTPLIWQAGKFFITGIILLAIYFNSKFTNKVKMSLVIFYFIIFIIFLINVISGVLYNSFSTDEVEYCIYIFMLFPFSILSKKDLNNIAHGFEESLNTCQWILILSNWFVIYNYFIKGVLPFHAYEGILLRFGGLWDDPNALAIISVLLFGYSVIKRQYFLAFLNVINIILAISFSGYILLIVSLIFFFFKSNVKKSTKIIAAGITLILGFLVIFYNYDLITTVYEAKRQSVAEHTTLDIEFNILPLTQSIQFHETWFFSMNANYFPFSIIIDIAVLVFLIKAVIDKRITIQNLLFVIFATANVFLPFLYMFPVNFLALFLFILYLREVYI